MTPSKNLKKTRSAFSKKRIYFLWGIFFILFAINAVFGNRFYPFLWEQYQTRYISHRLCNYDYSKEHGALREDIEIAKSLPLETQKKMILLLSPNLKSPLTPTSEQAFQILRELPYHDLEPIYPLLKNIFKTDTRFKVRVKALEALAKMKLHSEERFQILSENLNHTDYQKNSTPIYLMYREFYQKGIYQKDIEQMFIDALKTVPSSDYINHYFILSILKEIGANSALSIAIPLLEYLDSSPLSSQMAKLETLECIGHISSPKKEELPKLLSFLQHPNKSVSQESKKLLEKFASQNKSAVSLFIGHFQQETELEIQKTIITLIGEAYSSHPSEESETNIFEFFTQNFQTFSSELKVKMAEVLAKLQFQKSNLLLISLLQDEWQVRAKVAWALGQNRDPNVVPTLLEMLKDKNEYVKENVAYALYRFEITKEQIPQLEKIQIEEKNLTVKNILTEILKSTQQE